MIELSARGIEKPKSPEHRDAYLALTQHSTNLVNAHAFAVEEGDTSRDVELISPTAAFHIDMMLGEYEVLFSMSRTATEDDGVHAPITFCTQTHDEIWRSQKYPSYEAVRAASHARGGALQHEVPGTFEEVYGQAMEPAEVYGLVEELLRAEVEE
jgi:hypothetical protein